MTQYTLQTIALHSATFKIYLYSAFASLTIPTGQTLLIKNDFIERVDIGIGDYEIESHEFEFVEDYSTYSEGFWKKVLSDDLQIRVDIDEGSGYTNFFWGRNVPELTQFGELDLTVGAIRREGVFTCISLLANLQDELTLNLVIEVPGNGLVFDNGVQAFVSLKGIIASMLKLTFGGGYDITDCVVRGNDFQYRDSSSVAYVLFEALEMRWPTYDTPPTSGSITLIENYANCWDLLRDICKTFGFIPRYFYEGGRHKIELLTRGSYLGSDLANLSSMNNVPMESSVVLSANSFLNVIKVTSDATAYPEVYVESPQPIARLIAVPNFVVVDYETLMIYNTYTTPSPFANLRGLFNQTSVGVWNPIDRVKYRDYTTAGQTFTVVNTFSGGGFSYDNVAAAMAGYLLQRFGVAYSRKTYERTYPGIQATRDGVVSHFNLKVGNIIGIDDQATADVIIHDCETAWTAGAGVVATADADSKVGVSSAKLVTTGVGALSVLGGKTLGAAINLSAMTFVELWMKSSISLIGGDLQLLLDDSPSVASPVETIDLPALSANVWKHVLVRLATPGGDSAIVSFGIKQVPNLADFTLRVDDVRAVKMSLYYATEVRKNIFSDQTFVRWDEITPS